jgi:hypothetical protein
MFTRRYSQRLVQVAIRQQPKPSKPLDVSWLAPRRAASHPQLIANAAARDRSLSLHRRRIAVLTTERAAG